ncbi:MAG: flagellar biosynthetic protein FliR [Pseudomonadota bacterium]
MVSAMLISDSQIANWISAGWLPFVRISAAMMAAPLFSHRAIPRQIRLGVALMLALLLMPWQPAMSDFNPLSLQGLLLTANELILGICLGFMLQLVFEAVMFAGQFIATGMGLGFASVIDQQQGISVAVMGQFFMLITMLLFLAMNGHLAFIKLLADSFVAWPVGTAVVQPETFGVLLTAIGGMLRNALGIALPAVVALLVVQIAMGVMSRAAPTLNLFAVGFPVTLMLGLLVVERTLPALLPQVQRLLTIAFENMGLILESAYVIR